MRYLIRKHGLKVKAHIWNGNNTACNMLIDDSGVPDNFSVYPNSQSKKICQNCIGKQLEKAKGNTAEKNRISGSAANLKNSIHAKTKHKNKRKLSKKNKKKLKNNDNFYNSKEWRRIRYEALKIHGRQCLCCGQKAPNVELHVDHIKPRSKYPELELDINNLQILCKDCNLGKSNRDCIDYRVNKLTNDEYLDLNLVKSSPIA